MLTLTNAWTNQDPEADRSYAIWLLGHEPSGQWWWLIAKVGARELGFVGADVLDVNGKNRVEREIEADDDPDSWSAIDPSEALVRVSQEFERARQTPWASDYAAHFETVRAEHIRLRRAVEVKEPIARYRRNS